MQACVNWVLITFGTQLTNKKWLVRPVFPDYLSVSYNYDCILFYYAFTDNHLNFQCCYCDYYFHEKKFCLNLTGFFLLGFYQTSEKLLPSKALR